ncbi:MAG: RDD family protein [Pirellulaceae bacterium]|nr:RDD family protein [Pirellulaceae bacterium]
MFLLLNGALIYHRGQTLGKLICGTVVVTRDFRRVSGNRYVFLRYLSVVVIGQPPVLGVIFGVADSLAIFRREKNCLHDDIAGTRVIMRKDLAERGDPPIPSIRVD